MLKVILLQVRIDLQLHLHQLLLYMVLVKQIIVVLLKHSLDLGKKFLLLRLLHHQLHYPMLLLHHQQLLRSVLVENLLNLKHLMLKTL
jgi:hypothetical protein